MVALLYYLYFGETQFYIEAEPDILLSALQSIIYDRHKALCLRQNIDLADFEMFAVRSILWHSMI